MKAVVFAGTRGIGGEISKRLRAIADEVVATGRKDVDTSDLDSVKSFCGRHPWADVLVLNTGGPDPIPFDEISEDQWRIAFHQLFLSFAIVLQRIEVRNDGFVFLISSATVREPDPKLILSNCYRVALTSLCKTLSKLWMSRRVTFVNIAPGPTRTDRLRDLLRKSGRTLEQLEAALPTGRVADPAEIGEFVRFVVEKRITAINGATISFDMGLSASLL